jgi:drug/metabolite transporter (DMT)-like permease
VLRAYLALVATIAGISWSAILVRWADAPGTVSALYRVLIAGAILFVWRGIRGSTRPVSARHAAIAIAGGVFFALDLALWNTAVMKTQAAVASILGNNTPIFVGMMAWLVLRKRPQASFWIGLALALAGCVLIMSVDLREDTTARGSLTGNALALIASVFFAAYLIVTERVRRSMDTLTFNALAIAGSIAALLAIALALDLPLTGYPPRTWAAFAGLGLVTQLAAYYALVYALGHLPATITSVGLLAQVPCTAALAWLLLGESLTATQIAGGGIVLAGIYVVNRRPEVGGRGSEVG